MELSHMEYIKNKFTLRIQCAKEKKKNKKQKLGKRKYEEKNSNKIIII